MKLSFEQAKTLMDCYGNLDLRGTGITSLPDNLTVGGWLDLSGTGITSLPENLTVGGELNLRGTGITSLPDNLTVGGWLDLNGTGITSLPDNLTVGGGLYLSGTGITSLPDNLTVGGWLGLSGTRITSLPDNLIVGGGLDLRNTRIIMKKNIKRLKNGEYSEDRWIYVDNILTHIRGRRKVGKYIFFEGRIKGKNVITDGTNYAHCNTVHDGIEDLLFKSAVERGADQYRNIPLDKKIPVDICKTMYRVITGACRQGTDDFILNLGDTIQPEYTILEIIDLTRGQYGAKRFSSFFKEAL